jgi:drug/metabolite transporter (DMT)-like permease
MATSSSPANPAERPTAGIATALVLGVLTIVWVAQRDPPRSQEMQDANALFNALTVSGNAVLLILALSSLWGHRWAHARIRGLSAAMIAALCGIMLLLWHTIVSLTEPRSAAQYAIVAGLMLAGTALHAAPWILYLRLFRKSRYP